jgi:hypothetical protein
MLPEPVLDFLSVLDYDILGRISTNSDPEITWLVSWKQHADYT